MFYTRSTNLPAATSTETFAPHHLRNGWGFSPGAGFIQPSADAMTQSWASNLRHDAVGGLVSSAIAIPLAIGFGMFAFVTLGDEYFA